MKKIKNIYMYSIGILVILFGLYFLQSSDSSDASIYPNLKTKEFGELQLSMEYNSADQMILKQFKNKDQISSKQKKFLKKEMNDYLSFQLKIENLKGNGILKNLVSTVPDYQTLIQYLSFDIQNDIFLCTENDTLKCAFTHFERNFDLAPYANVEVGFYRDELRTSICQNDQWSVLYHADHLGLGPLYFNYESDKVCDK